MASLRRSHLNVQKWPILALTSLAAAMNMGDIQRQVTARTRT